MKAIKSSIYTDRFMIKSGNNLWSHNTIAFIQNIDGFKRGMQLKLNPYSFRDTKKKKDIYAQQIQRYVMAGT